MAAGIKTQVGGVELQSSAVYSIFIHQKNAKNSFWMQSVSLHAECLFLRPEHTNGKRWDVLLITLTLYQSFAVKWWYCFINNPPTNNSRLIYSGKFPRAHSQSRKSWECRIVSVWFAEIFITALYVSVFPGNLLPSKRPSPSSLNWVSIYVHTSPPWQQRNDKIMPGISQTRISSIISHMRDCKFRINPTAMTYKNNSEPFHGLIPRQDRENSSTVAVQEGTWWQQEIKAREQISFPAFVHVIFFWFLRAFIAAEKPKEATDVDVDVPCKKNMGTGPNTIVWLTLELNSAFCWL